MSSILNDLEPVEKYLFLLLYAKGPKKSLNEAIRGNLWLQKEVFLISKNVEELAPEFEAYRLGPFSEALDESLDQLITSDYVQRTREGLKLTKHGQEVAEEVWKNADKKTKQIIEDAKSLLNDMTNNEVLVFIYSTFEDMTKDSEIKDTVERNRRRVAFRLFRKGKISLQRAAQIAKISLEEFKQELKKLGIPAVEYHNDELTEELSGANPYSS